MKASIEHWDIAGQRVHASLESEGSPELYVCVACYETEEARGWHTDRTDTVLRVDERAQVMDENGDPCDTMDLSENAREAIEDALAPLFQEEQVWRGIDAVA